MWIKDLSQPSGHGIGQRVEAGRAWGKSIGEQETGWAATVESKLDREEHFIFVEESKAGNWGAKILLKGLQTSGSLVVTCPQFKPRFPLAQEQSRIAY